MPHSLLAASTSGDHLAHNAATNTLELRAHADDECMWTVEFHGRVVCSTGLRLLSTAASSSTTVAGLEGAFGPGAGDLVPKKLRLSIDDEGSYEVDGRDVVDGDPARSLERAERRAAAVTKPAPQAAAYFSPLGRFF